MSECATEPAKLSDRFGITLQAWALAPKVHAWRVPARRADSFPSGILGIGVSPAGGRSRRACDNPRLGATDDGCKRRNTPPIAVELPLGAHNHAGTPPHISRYAITVR